MFRNLPSSTKYDAFQAKIKEQIPPKDITDVKLIEDRRIAYVGFKTEEQAQKAINYFDQTFVFGNQKIKVELVDEKVSLIRDRTGRGELALITRHLTSLTRSNVDISPMSYQVVKVVGMSRN
jgi:RNA recognition motif-containing protein